jgi:hypothetical protein
MWNSIDPSEIDLLPDELAVLQAIEGSSAILPNILTRTVNAARGSIIAGGNQLGPDGTIPDQIRQEVIDISRWAWIASFPEMGQLATEARQKLHDQARETLARIAAGAIRVEVPAVAVVTPAPGNAAALLRRGRHPRASTMDLTATT